MEGGLAEAVAEEEGPRLQARPGFGGGTLRLRRRLAAAAPLRVTGVWVGWRLGRGLGLGPWTGAGTAAVIASEQVSSGGRAVHDVFPGALPREECG